MQILYKLSESINSNKIYKRIIFISLFFFAFLITLESLNLDPWNCSEVTRFCGEFGIIEMSQNILLVTYFFITFFSLRLIQKNFDKRLYQIKCFAIILLIYEEISHITNKIFEFTNSYNIQNELNIHNSKFIYQKLFVNLPPFFSENIFLDDVNLNLILGTTIIFLLCFGSYIPFFRKIKLLFLDARFSFVLFLYPINLIFSFILRRAGNVDWFLLNFELIELIVYFYFVLDGIYKINSIKTPN